MRDTARATGRRSRGHARRRSRGGRKRQGATAIRHHSRADHRSNRRTDGDAGNLVRANDQTPLVTINQVTPIDVSFAFPEAMLADLRRYMARGTLSVVARLANARGSRARTAASFRGQRRRSDDRHDQNQGHVRQRKSAAVARPVRQRRGPDDHRSRPPSSCRRRPCRRGRTVPTCTSSRRTRPSSCGRSRSRGSPAPRR